MKVLIIEDEKQLAKSVLLALRHEGYVCEVAYSAAEANEKIAVFDYDQPSGWQRFENPGEY